jgi:hypothetical protein
MLENQPNCHKDDLRALKLVSAETAASRVRGGTQAFALPTFQWRADSGVGVIFRNYLRLDLAYGSGEAASRLRFRDKHTSARRGGGENVAGKARPQHSVFGKIGAD